MAQEVTLIHVSVHDGYLSMFTEKRVQEDWSSTIRWITVNYWYAAKPLRTNVACWNQVILGAIFQDKYWMLLQKY